MKLSELGQVSRLVILLYGQPLAGKTVLASQFPHPVFIELDEKLTSVLTARARGKEKFDFDTFSIDEDETTDEDFIKLCGKAFARQSAWIKTQKLTERLLETLPQDATLIIDSITRLAEHLIRFIEKTTNHKPIQLQDWNAFTMHIADYRDLLRSTKAKCNVIIIGHEDTIENKLTGAIEKTLYLPTKQRYRLPGVADEYWLLKANSKLKGNKRVNSRTLQIVPDRTSPSGSSSWMDNLDEPTYAKIRPYLENGLGRKLPEPTWTPQTNY